MPACTSMYMQGVQSAVCSLHGNGNMQHARYTSNSSFRACCLLSMCATFYGRLGILNCT